MTTDAGSDTQRFAALLDVFGPRVFAYARRHVERSAVEDIVSETFLTAWRRLDDVPERPLPWLLVVARNTMANHHRSLARQDRLQAELAALDQVVPIGPTVADVVVTRAEMLAALAELTVMEREAVLLTAWDGLSDIQAAKVSGCSPRAFRVRLHRARRRLDRALDPAADEASERLHANASFDAPLEETP